MNNPEEPSEEEFERDFLEMDAQIAPRRKLSDDEYWEDEAQAFADGEIQRKFYLKHRARLEAHGIDVDARLAGLAHRRAKVLETGQAYEKAAENYFQSQADEAEERTRKIEQMLGALRFFESQTEADWTRFTPEEQEDIRNLIAKLREELPRMLSQIPLELRQKWEKAGGDSGAGPEN